MPSGCAALYRRAMLDQIGGFDEDFFLYCEDTDVGLRAQLCGWTCVCAASAVVRHRYSQTAGAVSLLKARYVERNRLWIAIRLFPLPLLLALPFTSFLRYFLQWRAARRGQGIASAFVANGGTIREVLGAILRAHAETIWVLPILLRKRSEIRLRRRIGSFRFISLIWTHRLKLREFARAC